jgi:hypothetical protein
MYFRGAYFVGKTTTENKKIDFYILDPNDKVVYTKRRLEEGIFRFNSTGPGVYSFVLSNMKVSRSITFRTRKAQKTVR